MTKERTEKIYLAYDPERVCPECRGDGTIPIDTPFSGSLPSADCPTCQGTGKHKPDRPELREIRDLILDFIKPYEDANVGSILLSDIGNLVKRIFSLFPDEEAKREERERIMKWIEKYRWIAGRAITLKEGTIVIEPDELQVLKGEEDA